VAGAPPGPPQPVFYYDLGSPACYLAAEQVLSALPVVAEWEPVHGAALGLPPEQIDREAIAQQAQLIGLQPLRWPGQWPPDTREAMLTATYAKRGGRAVAFSLAAFRQAFAAGRDLGDSDTVLIAAAAAEMHPTAVLKGIGLRSTSDALDRACARAAAAGIRSLPAIQTVIAVHEGDELLVAAARAIGEAIRA
jgi:2-hydroxychromene-2-carboxylate isomerase